MFSVYFCSFSSKSTIGHKIGVTSGNERIHTPSPSPGHCSKLGCFFISSSISGTTLHGEDGEGKAFFSSFQVFLTFFIELKTSFTMLFENNHKLNKLYYSTKRKQKKDNNNKEKRKNYNNNDKDSKLLRKKLAFLRTTVH